MRRRFRLDAHFAGILLLLAAAVIIIHHFIIAGIPFDLKDVLHHEYFASIFAIVGGLLLIR